MESQAFIADLGFWTFFKIALFGIGIFSFVYWISGKTAIFTKVAFFTLVYLTIDKFSQTPYDEAYKGIIYLQIILVGVSCLYLGLINNIKKRAYSHTPFLNKTLQKHRAFDSLNFVSIYTIIVGILLFPVENENIIFVLFCIWCGCVYLLWGSNALNKIYKEICEMVDSLGDNKYFTLPQIYQKLDIQGKRYKFKAFIDEIVQSIESTEQIAKINLYGTDFYFAPQDLANLITQMESIPKQTPKMSFKDATKEASKIIDLPPTHLEDFLKSNGNVNKYIFDNGAYFIHNVNLDNFVFCSSCGKAEDKNATNDIDGEWFCSSLCEDTENRCLEISEDLNPVILDGENYESYKERFTKNLSNTTSTAAITLGVSEVWAKNFKAIQGSEDFLKYTKGYTESTTSYTDANGKFVNVGDLVDNSGNKVNLNATGHGFTAENINHENDVWAGKKAELVGGDNAKNGADRIVDGMEIQTKYLKTVKKSVNAGFDNKGDGNY